MPTITGEKMQALAATYYDVLGIGPEATLADIKAAYARQLGAFREKMKTPEKPAAESLDALRQAFTILGDPLSRESYDASLNGVANQAVVQEPQAEPAIPTHTPAATAEPAEPREENFRFTGEGGEYFRIWIVNILLSIVTLGIYS